MSIWYSFVASKCVNILVRLLVHEGISELSAPETNQVVTMIKLAIPYSIPQGSEISPFDWKLVK